MNPDEPFFEIPFFTIAVLAVQNIPRVLLSDAGFNPNPEAPLLFSFALFANGIPDEPLIAKDMINRAVAAQVYPKLPPGYIIALTAVQPITAQTTLQAAAFALNQPLSTFEGTPGSAFYDENTGENTFNSYRPGIGQNGKSPRMAFRCPYCGTGELRIDRSVDTRNPDGYRAVMRMEPGGQDAPPFVTSEGPDFGGAEWTDHTGVSIDVTCKKGHNFAFCLVEDSTDKGPCLFIVFDYKEPAPRWLKNKPGSRRYPLRP